MWDFWLVAFYFILYTWGYFFLFSIAKICCVLGLSLACLLKEISLKLDVFSSAVGSERGGGLDWMGWFRMRVTPVR